MKLNDSTLLKTECYINGKWVSSAGSTIEIRNPATEASLAKVPSLGAKETRAAIDAAAKAWPEWRGFTAHYRSTLLRRWATLILENIDDLATILTSEQGKPITEARGEISYAASYIEWFAEEGRRAYGELIPTHDPDKRLMVSKEPVGVCAAITPWNFPAAMITRKVAAALAAGCPIVVKPAAETPLSAFALAELAERSGIPAGVFSVITGDAIAIGGEMTSNPTVRKLSFTGSTKVGRLLMQQCAPSLKKLSLELGGNAPFIVFDDADIDAAVEGAMASKFRNAGQTCVCTNRFYIQRGIHDTFVERLIQAVKDLRTGNGLEDLITQGPLIDRDAIDKVEKHIADALSKGASLVRGGTRDKLGGLFFEPTVISGVTTDMLVSSEETFGPLAPISIFDTEEEVISLANASEFGLAAYFYTTDLSRAWRLPECL
jgi:succinate-semialdehyde dehydrogenase/glutarate-semialdehyde dehydrogenase